MPSSLNSLLSRLVLRRRLIQSRREARAAIVRLTKELARQRRVHNREQRELREQLDVARRDAMRKGDAGESQAAEIATLQSRVELLTGEVEFLSKWQAKELARLETETAIFSAKKTLALEGELGGEQEINE